MPRQKQKRIIEVPSFYDHSDLEGRMCFSIPNFNPHPQPLANYLMDVCSYPKDDPYFETDQGRSFVNYRAMTAMQFWRKGNDSRIPCPFECFDITGRELKELVRAEADLWLKTLDMIERLFTIIGASHPAFTFRNLLIERGLLLPMYAYREDPVGSATSFIRELQGQNSQMLSDAETLDNPFAADQYPTTRILIDAAFSAAAKNDVFRKNCYLPMVRARGHLLQVVLRQSPETRVLLPDGRTIVPVRPGPKSLKPKRGKD